MLDHKQNSVSWYLFLHIVVHPPFSYIFFLCVNAPHGPERRALQHCITQNNNENIQSDYSQGKKGENDICWSIQQVAQHRSITWHRHNNHDGQKPLGGKHTRHANKGAQDLPLIGGVALKGIRSAYSIPHPVPPKITPRARMVPATAPISLLVATLTAQRK